MDINEILGMDVVDDIGQNVGTLEDIFCDSTGVVNHFIIKLDKGLFNKDDHEVKFSEVTSIKDVILLNIKIDMD
ncbi:MAG: PRC-barrel domain-containing protein [Methanobacteriaceae archaeon]|jgi:sporulation protein YlmC with PRC-barrel domain|nr:PRC-barrel domain-containing protein [Methanobacteriaceae archaeon]